MAHQLIEDRQREIAAKVIRDWLCEQEGYGVRWERLREEAAGNIMPWLVEAYMLGKGRR